MGTLPLKKVNNADTGDADHVGGNDWDDLADYQNNVDKTGPVKINTRTYYRSGKRELRNPADTFSYIEKGSAIAANRDVTEPLLTGNDTRVYQAHTQALTNKTIDIKDNTLALRDYSARVFKVGSTYYARKYDGSLIDSGTTFETVAQAAIDENFADIIIGGNDSNEVYEIQSDPLVISDTTIGTSLTILKNASISVPEGYTGTAIHMLDCLYSTVNLYGYIFETGTPARDWTGIKLEATNGGSGVSYNIINSYGGVIYECDTCIELKATGSGFTQANVFNSLTLQNFIKGIVYNSVTGGSLGGNTFNGCIIQCAPYSTHGVKDVDNGGDNHPNDFIGCHVWDLPGGADGITILSGGVVNIIGGKMEYDSANDASTATCLINALDGINMPNGKNIILNTSTGTKIGTSTSQKLGFYNATPVTQRTGIADVNNSTVDNTYGQQENDVITSLRTKVNAILQVLEDMGITAVA
jgi:hypothetical protein